MQGVFFYAQASSVVGWYAAGIWPGNFGWYMAYEPILVSLFGANPDLVRFCDDPETVVLINLSKGKYTAVAKNIRSDSRGIAIS